MTEIPFIVQDWPEPVKRRVEPILKALLTAPRPVKRCDHIDYCIGAAFTCAVDFNQIGLVCEDCIQAHLLLVDRFEVADVCEACAHKGKLNTAVHDSADVEGWVPPRIEWLENDDQRFWQGHLTICNAWAVCSACKEELQASRDQLV